MSSMRLTLSNLPIELVYRILNHLSSFEILMSTRNVCPVLNRIIDTYQPNQDTHQLTLSLSSFNKFTPYQITETLEKTNLKPNSLSLVVDVLDKEVICSLLELLGNNQKIIELKMVVHWSHWSKMGFIFRGLMLNNTIKILNLTENTVGFLETYHLDCLFHINRTITTLLLKSNFIQDAGAVSVACVLRSNQTLKTLDLSMNEIGDRGARFLSEMLLENRALIELNLEGNRISEEGARHLSNALKTNRTLKILNLEDNPIGDVGLQYFSKHKNRSFFRLRQCKVLMTTENK